MNNDLISRSALIKWIDDSVSQYGHIYSTDMLNMWGLFKDYLINNVPTVEYPFYQEAYQTGYEEGKNERTQGEWIMDKEHTSNSLLWYKCNKCGIYHSPTNYCPNCGADMRGGAE